MTSTKACPAAPVPGAGPGKNKIVDSEDTSSPSSGQPEEAANQAQHAIAAALQAISRGDVERAGQFARLAAHTVRRLPSPRDDDGAPARVGPLITQALEAYCAADKDTSDEERT